MKQTSGTVLFVWCKQQNDLSYPETVEEALTDAMMNGIIKIT